MGANRPRRLPEPQGEVDLVAWARVQRLCLREPGLIPKSFETIVLRGPVLGMALRLGAMDFLACIGWS